MNKSTNFSRQSIFTQLLNLLDKSKYQRILYQRIAYWDSTNGRLFEFITNIMELAAEMINNYDDSE